MITDRIFFFKNALINSAKRKTDLNADLTFTSRGSLQEQDRNEVYCDKSFSLWSMRSPLLQRQAAECIIYPIIMPHWADKGRCRELLTKTGTRATATVAKALHQRFRHSFPTSWHYDRHSCWTRYCLDRFRMERWRGEETGGDKIQRSLLEKLEERARLEKKKSLSRFSTLTEKSMPQPEETENMSFTPSERNKSSRTATTYACSCQAPATNTRGINKVNSWETIKKATLLVLLDLLSPCRFLSIGGGFTLFSSSQISKLSVHLGAFCFQTPFKLSKSLPLSYITNSWLVSRTQQTPLHTSLWRRLWFLLHRSHQSCLCHQGLCT